MTNRPLLRRKRKAVASQPSHNIKRKVGELAVLPTASLSEDLPDGGL